MNCDALSLTGEREVLATAIYLIKQTIDTDTGVFVGTHQSVFHTNAINLEHYVGDSHVVAVGLDKIQSDTGEDNFSSVSTKMGDLLSFRVKNIKTTVTQAWVTLRHSAVLILSEEGAQYLD